MSALAKLVKPLEWVSGGGGYDWRAECAFGAYALTEFDGPSDDVFRVRMIDITENKVWFRHADEAKAAAQADYEARILSALNLPMLTALSEDASKAAELARALEPFAKAADIRLCGEWRDDQSISRTDVAFYITFGDLRRARAALDAKP